MIPSTAFTEQNTKKVDFSISLEKANLVGIPLFFLLMALVLFPYDLIWGWLSLLQSTFDFLKFKVFLPLLVGGTIVHELLHALGWKIFSSQPWSVFKFGFNWKTITPYAHCTVPLKASAYRKGTFLPGLVLGILPSIFGIIFHNGIVMLFGSFFLGAASGDFLCLWLMRSVPPHSFIQDHPTRAGCLAYIEQSNESNETHPV